MADRTVSIRLSLQDHEKVRQALEKLGPEGQKALQRIEQAAAPASRGLLAVDAASRQAQGSVHQLAGRAGPLGAVLGALGPGGLAAAAGLGALAGALAFVRRQAAAADELQHVADRLGTTAEALQEFRFAADQASGVAAGAADQAFRAFTQRVAEAQAGTGELTATLAQYGIALTDADGRLRSTEAILGDVADATAGAATAQEQLRIAAKAFGEEGSGLVNLLRQGSTGFEAWAEEARRSGAVLQNDVVAQLASANTEVGRLTQVTETQLAVALADLSPILVGVAQGLAAVAKFAADVYNSFLDLEDLSVRGLTSRREELLSDLGTVTGEYTALNNQILKFEERGQTRAADAKRETLAVLAAEAAALREQIAAVDRQIETLRTAAPARPEATLNAVGLPSPAQVDEVDRAVERIAERAAAADLAEAERRIDTLAGYDAAVQAQVEREARARQKAAGDAAKAREKAEGEAQRAIDREREEAYREAVRNTENLADSLVDAGRGFLDALFDGSRTFWEDFADLGRRTLTAIASEQLFRAPATAFAEGLFGTGGPGGGANAGGIAGPAGSLGRSVASSAIADAIGLPSIGSLLGFGGGGAAAGGAAAAGSLGAFGGMSATAVEAAAAASAASGAAGAGFLTAAAPFALPAAALAGAYLLSGGLDKPSVGPNASARIGLRDGRFGLKVTGSDNGGERFLAEVEAEALAAAEILNRAAETLGRAFDERRLHEIPDPGLATQAGDQFRRTGGQLAEEVLRSGALGDLTADQIATALGGGSVLGAEIEAVLAALDAGGGTERLRAAEALIARAAQDEVASRQELVRALERNADAARDVAAGLREGVADLRLDEGRGLAPGERLAEAERQFNQALSLGDAARAQALSGVLLESANAFFGTGSVGATAVFDRIVAGLEEQATAADRRAVAEDAALAAAEAQLAAVRQDTTVSAEALAAAEATAATAREELAALDAIRAALATESPDAKLLRGQLDALERLGAGQDATANAVRDLLTTLSSAAGGPSVVSIAAGRAGTGTDADRFATHVAEIEAFRARGYAGGTESAVPGYAWVGERGPELMRFAGGERVVPAGASRGASVDSVALLGQAVELLQASVRVQAAAGDRQAAALARLGDELEQLGGPLRRLAAER